MPGRRASRRRQGPSVLRNYDRPSGRDGPRNAPGPGRAPGSTRQSRAGPRPSPSRRSHSAPSPRPRTPRRDRFGRQAASSPRRRRPRAFVGPAGKRRPARGACRRIATPVRERASPADPALHPNPQRPRRARAEERQERRPGGRFAPCGRALPDRSHCRRRGRAGEVWSNRTGRGNEPPRPGPQPNQARSARNRGWRRALRGPRPRTRGSGPSRPSRSPSSRARLLREGSGSCCRRTRTQRPPRGADGRGEGATASPRRSRRMGTCPARPPRSGPSP